MPPSPPTLHLMCGKAASGKSTLAARLGAQPGTVILGEDGWLAALYTDRLNTLSDYARCAARLEAAIGPHVVALLGAGLSVVLDFQANTPARRDWMRTLIEASGADHLLHVLDVPDAVCLARHHAPDAEARSAIVQFLSRSFAAPQ